MRPLKWEIRKNLNHKSQNDTQEIDKFNGAFEIEFSLTFTWPGLSLLRGPTQTGLKVEARLDKRSYKKGIKISDEEMKKINLKPHEFHGEWNYTVKYF